jgi:hypothetical protein
MRCANECGNERDVFPRSQFAVQTVAMADKADTASHRRTIASKIDTQYRGGAARERGEAGAQTQERGLPGTVGAAQGHQLTSTHVERCTGQSGESCRSHHCVSQVNH